METITAERIGKNIKTLRKGFKETQAELGAVINSEHNTISSYENGRTEPDANTISLIAEHYLVTPEVITQTIIPEDFHYIINSTYVLHHLNVFCPIVKNEVCLNNELFCSAVDLQERIINDLKNDNYESFIQIFECMDMYDNIYENDNTLVEASANSFGMYLFFLSFILSVYHMTSKNTAVLNTTKKEKLITQDLKIASQLGKDFFDSYTDEDYMTLSKELIGTITIIRESKYKDLAYFYLALIHMYGLVYDNRGYEHASSVGSYMLDALAAIDNKYAKSLDKFITSYRKLFTNKS